MKSLLRMGGLLMVLCGLSAAIYFYAYFDTTLSVPGGSLIGVERVHNIGLMQQRSDSLLMSGVSIVAGLLLILLGRDSKR